MNKLKTILWDLDGTIADTETNGHRIAFNLAFSDFKLNWKWNKSLYYKLLEIAGGKNRILHYSKIIDYDLHKELAEEIHQRKQSYYLDIISLKS